MLNILVYVGIAAVAIWLLKKFIKFSGKIALIIAIIVVIALVVMK